MPQATTQAEHEGFQEMVTAIGAAFQRAKARGTEDEVYHYMTLPRNRASKLPLVRFLQKKDSKDYHPGTWFEESKYFKTTYALGFKNRVELVEAQVDGFDWGSWYQP